MDWYRAYHGLCTDPKLHRIARSIGVSRGFVVAGWMAVMETASANSNRGYVGDFDHVTMAFMIDSKPHVAAKIWDAFQSAGMVSEDGKVTAWDRRQRASDDPAVRKRNQRERERQTNPLETKETHAPRHVTNPTVEQNRTEQRKKDAPSGASKERASPTGGSRIDPQWQPTPADIEFARKEGLTDDEIQREAGRFRDYWHGAVGQRARKSDWASVWRNWARKAADDRNRTARGAGGNGSGSGGNGRTGNRSAGLVANTLAVLHRRGSLGQPFVH